MKTRYAKRSSRQPRHLRGPRGTEIDPRPVFEDQVAELKEYQKGFAWGLCPFHEDRKPSFSVHLDSGWYRCNSASCGVEGSGIVSFVSELLDLNFHEALDYLEQNYG